MARKMTREEMMICSLKRDSREDDRALPTWCEGGGLAMMEALVVVALEGADERRDKREVVLGEA